MHNKDDWVPRTNLTRWRLDVDEGRHHWRYVSEEESLGRPQSVAEKLFLSLETGAPLLPKPSSYMDAARNGLQFYQLLQLEDGHWGCDYGGPSFLLPGIIFAMYISGTEIPEEWKTEITRYLANTANDDGGWGLHLEGDSTVFATTCYYIVLRIFGLGKEHPLTVKARERIHTLGRIMLWQER
jgi:lanosterol synthase